MATTKWIQTLSNKYLGEYPYVGGELALPHPFMISGNGKVIYVAVGGSGVSRFECSEDNIWTRENFVGIPHPDIPGTKYLPNSSFVRPVATSEDGNTLVLMHTADPRHGDMAIKRKIIIVSYVNGQLVQVGSDITFTRQSNYNSEPLNQTNYYIHRVFISKDGLKIVIVTTGGINTLVFSNGSWNLLSASPDILPSYFPFAGYGEIGSRSNMSKNGMYLTLLNTTGNSIVVFKFDNQTNNWVLFGTISHSSLNSIYGLIYIAHTYVSNTGIVLAITEGSYALSRFEYNLSTSSYNFVIQSNLTSIMDGQQCFVSEDFNTFLFRSIDRSWPPSGISRQYIQMIKWTNGNWVKNDFPSNIIPFMTSDSQTTAWVLGMSSDATTFVSTPILTADKDIINVYYNVPPPTLYLGNNAVIKNSDVSFNSANVFVKAPTVALNVTNKNYVDVADSEVNTLILANANADTTSTTEYYDLLGQRQTVQSTLAVQIENLYQYFFNASRANAMLFYSILTSPLETDGCSLWLDGADSSSVIRSGSSVSEWNDKSSREYTFIQTNSDKRPSYTTNGLDGKSTITFANDFLSGASGLELGQNSFSMFVVARSNGFNGEILSKMGLNVGEIRMGMSGGYTFPWAKHGNNGLSTVPGVWWDDFFIYETVVNRVEGKDTFYINGAIPETSSAISTYTPDISYNATNSANMILGGYTQWWDGEPYSVATGFEGQIAEVVMYLNPSDLTNSKRYQIEGYLAHKWGLESKLPNNHPFKTATSVRQ